MTEPVKHDLDKLSGLLRAAVEDVQQAEGRGYGLDMSDWITRSEDGSCTVCMAGSMLIAGRFGGYDEPTHMSPLLKELGVSPGAYAQMRAVDAMRTGSMVGALRALLGTEITPRGYTVLYAAENVINDMPFNNGMVPFDAYLKAAQILEDGGL